MERKAKAMSIIGILSIILVVAGALLSYASPNLSGQCTQCTDLGAGEDAEPDLCEQCQPKTCTDLGIGKDATWDGSTICTQSADCGMCDPTLHLVPAAKHKPGEMKPIYKWTQTSDGWENKPGELICYIPEVEYTYAYFRAVFGHMNEHGLSIGENTLGSRRELSPEKPNDLIFDVTELSMIACERCTTAREAIKLMGSLAEEYGFVGGDWSWAGESLIIADGKEVWVFEVHPSDKHWSKDSGKPGAIWCAQRVPDDHFVISPNESIIKEIDLDNKDYFMASSNVFQVAIDNGWWDPTSGKPFRWDLAYEGRKASSYRLWRGLSLAAPSLNLKPPSLLLPEEDYPFSVKPDKKLTFQDIREIHGDHFEGTVFDKTKGLAAGPWGCPNWPRSRGAYTSIRSIGVMNSEYIVINQVRGWLPDEIKGVMWWGCDDGDTTCYVPFYCSVTEIPEEFTIGNHHEVNVNSAFWIFNLVNNFAQLKYDSAIKEINEAQYDIESEELGMQEFVVDPQALKLLKSGEKGQINQARKYLTDYCNSNAKMVLKRWWALFSQLMDKYDDTGHLGRPPEWWANNVTCAAEKCKGP